MDGRGMVALATLLAITAGCSAGGTPTVDPPRDPVAASPPASPPPSDRPPASPSDGADATSAAPTTPVPALAFEGRSLDGGTVRFSDHGGRDLALWLWAPW